MRRKPSEPLRQTNRETDPKLTLEAGDTLLKIFTDSKLGPEALDALRGSFPPAPTIIKRLTDGRAAKELAKAADRLSETRNTLAWIADGHAVALETVEAAFKAKYEYLTAAAGLIVEIHADCRGTLEALEPLAEFLTVPGFVKNGAIRWLIKKTEIMDAARAMHERTQRARSARGGRRKKGDQGIHAEIRRLWEENPTQTAPKMTEQMKTAGFGVEVRTVGRILRVLKEESEALKARWTLQEILKDYW